MRYTPVINTPIIKGCFGGKYQNINLLNAFFTRNEKQTY